MQKALEVDFLSAKLEIKIVLPIPWGGGFLIFSFRRA